MTETIKALLLASETLLQMGSTMHRRLYQTPGFVAPAETKAWSEERSRELNAGAVELGRQALAAMEAHSSLHDVFESHVGSQGYQITSKDPAGRYLSAAMRERFVNWCARHAIPVEAWVASVDVDGPATHEAARRSD